MTDAFAVRYADFRKHRRIQLVFRLETYPGCFDTRPSIGIAVKLVGGDTRGGIPFATARLLT